MMVRSTLGYVAHLLLVVIFLASPTVGLAKENARGQQQSEQGPLLCIIDPPNTSSFPNVRLNFRMVNSNLMPILDITDQALRIAENNQPAVPVMPGMQINATAGGIEYYLIVDKGNRSSQVAVKSILQNFVGYFNQQTDTVKIYTNENNAANLYYPGKGGNTITQAISNFPTSNDNTPRQVMTALSKVLSQAYWNMLNE